MSKNVATLKSQGPIKIDSFDRAHDFVLTL